jgi:hypothetical protein
LILHGCFNYAYHKAKAHTVKQDFSMHFEVLSIS